MATLENLTKEGRDQVIAMAIDYIKDNNPSCYACDFHNEIYNMDYFIIGRYQAEQWLTKHYGVFNAIGDIQKYEQDNFGEVNTKLDEPENVVNMLVYIAGEEVLSQSETLQDVWNDQLTESDCEKIIAELEELLN